MRSRYNSCVDWIAILLCRTHDLGCCNEDWCKNAHKGQTFGNTTKNQTTPMMNARMGTLKKSQSIGWAVQAKAERNLH